MGDLDHNATLWARRLLLAALLVALAALCALVLAPFATPIVWAAILAFASWPLYRRLRRLLHRTRTIPALLMTLLLGCAVALPVLWIMILVQRELLAAYRLLTHYLAEGPHTLPTVIANVPWAGDRLQELLDRYAADPNSVTQELSAYMLSWARDVGGILSSVGRNAIRLSLTLLTLFFFYRDGYTIVHQADHVIKRFFADRIDRYIETASRMTRAVVYGLLITGLIQGFIAAIGYWIVGLTAPVLLGFLTAVLSLVPLVGTAIVWVPVGVYLLSTGHAGHGVVILLWCAILVYPADNVLRPMLISSAIQVPFLLVMFGALGGLSAFGLVGLFIGPVILATGLAIWREWTVRAAPPVS
ncbi:MAG TPA: AI-2E family transporter [Steroidobacteraceae bacterium]|nr:AI-2E family transporter [Steroidobacteraceae bacterium]